VSQGIDYIFRDYFKITDYRVYHILHQSIPTRKLNYYPIKPEIVEIDQGLSLYHIKKIIELL
jgi:hypothetical protein